MSNDQSWTMLRGVVLFAASAFVIAACGGSVEFTAGAGGAAAGAPSAGASSSGGAGAGGAGAGGAGASGAGASSSGGASAGSGGGNPCAGASCPAIACAKGLKYASVPGQCCGTCVPDPDACSKAQFEYGYFRDQLLAAPGALSCSVNADCRYLSSNAACGAPCVSSAVSARAAAGIEQQLTQFATGNCSFCPAEQPPCSAPPAPLCIDGMCILGGYA
jgi:hypothetical protein